MPKKKKLGHRPKGHGPVKPMSKKARAMERERMKKVLEDSKKRREKLKKSS